VLLETLRRKMSLLLDTIGIEKTFLECFEDSVTGG